MKRIISSAAAVWLVSLWMMGLPQGASGAPTFQTAKFYDGTEADSQEIGNRIPLIFVHGIREDASVWQSFIGRFWRSPSYVQNNFKPYVFQYATLNSDITSDPSNPTDVTGIGMSLGSFIQQWYSEPLSAPSYGFNGNKVIIVSHSYGGLVSRSMMANYFHGHLGSANVSLLVTLATPHHGTPAANAGGDVAKALIGLYPNIDTDMIWDCYDGNSTFGCATGIPSAADYSKIVAYGAAYTPVPIIGNNSVFDYSGPALCALGYCANDGIVPLGSALFANAPGVRQRQVVNSCDHDNICNGEYNVQGGIAIFDQIAADLMAVVPPQQPNTPPSVQTTQATDVTSSGATLNATISSAGTGGIIDARFEYTSGTFPGTVIYSVPVSGSTFSYNLNNLAPGTAYTYHAYAKNSAGLWNQVVNNVSFATQPQGSFQLTATAGANGTISPSGTFTVNAGASQTFTASGNSGYTPDQWTVDGSAAQSGGSIYTLQNIQEVHSVFVSFKADASQTHTLALASSNPSSGVTISISPGDLNGNNGGVSTPITLRYNAGTTVSLQAAFSANGIPFRRWTLDGAQYGTSFATSLSMDGNHVLTAIYLASYAVTPVAGGNGSISPSTAQEVDSGGSITFTASPAPGYVVDSWYVDGNQNPVGSGVATFTLNGVANNRIVTVTFKPSLVVTHTLTLNSSPNTGVVVSVNPADNYANSGGILPQTLTYNANTNITVTAPLSVGNNNFQKWQLDGQDFSTSFNVQVTSDTDHTLSAFFGPGPFAVTPVAGINGTISPDSPQLVNNGSNITFVATGASIHYGVDTWFVNSAPVQTNGVSFTLRELP
jgi:pimeloyl-ACP methyl ester carboxylesterase